jgi:multidrug efflux system membrane fusion protein
MTNIASPKSNKLFWIVALLLIVVGGTSAYRYWQATRTAAVPKIATPAVPVVTAIAAEEDVPVYLSGIGNVTPLFSVTVKVRVDGQLDSVAFVEGQTVKAGDLLAQIDPRPFQAQYQQALAQKARDEALLKNSQLDLDRYTLLWQQDSVSKQTFDTQRASVDQFKATVQADQALIDNARLQLDYTTVRAPISGRTGARLVDPGNIVKASDANGIVVINQIDPIAVIFTLPEDKFQTVNRAMGDGRKQLQVMAFAREDGTLLGTGKLTLINNQIDTATGTVQFKAVFPNPARALWPGQYVNAQIVLGNRQRAVTVPATVVQRGPNGLYAYVVGDDESVNMQSIKIAYTQGGKTVIEDGLKAGNRVVVDGQYKLKPGAKITEFQAAVPKSGNAGKGGAAKDRPTKEKK